MLTTLNSDLRAQDTKKKGIQNETRSLSRARPRTRDLGINVVNVVKSVAAMPRRKELRFRDLVELCREHGLFTRILETNNDDDVEDEELDRGQKNKLSRIIYEVRQPDFP